MTRQGHRYVRFAHTCMALGSGHAVSCTIAVASGGVCVAAEALLQIQLGGVHGLLLPQVSLDAPLMPLTHAAVADQDVKDHH